MIKVALFVRLEAKPGKEADLEKFLEAGLAMANQEATTPLWFALRTRTFDIRHLRRLQRRKWTAGAFDRPHRAGAHGQCTPVACPGTQH